jgi:hypothetical protein
MNRITTYQLNPSAKKEKLVYIQNMLNNNSFLLNIITNFHVRQRERERATEDSRQ